jgi:hypothetical protein
MISATVFIVLLLFILFRAWRKWEQRPEHDRKLYEMGNKINEIERLIAQQQDEEVCRELLAANAWVGETLTNVEHLPTNDLEAIRARVGAFVFKLS